MTRPQTQEMDDRLLRQAASWFVRIHNEDASAAEFGAWQQWLAQDPEHQRAFQSVEDFWQTAGSVANPPWPAVGELNSDVYDASQPVAQWRGEQQPVRRHRRVPRLFAAAAVLAAAIGATLFFVEPRPDSSRLADSASAMTASAQLREFTLSDGSKIALGAQSRATVNFTPGERRLIVDSGEAFIEVAKDPNRPFIVHAGNGTITALGTAFNVRNVGGRVVVTVVEGKVEVTDATETSKEPSHAVTHLIAGQELAYGSGPASARPVDTAIAMAWRSGHLKYLHEPLKFVIADVGRYTERHLAIVDPQVGELLYTGTVLPDEIDDWLTSVGESLPVRIVRLNSDTVLLKAAGAQE